jgi:hypothetical protein
MISLYNCNSSSDTFFTKSSFAKLYLSYTKISTSNPRSFLANACPVCPYPMMPTIFPSNSWPLFSSRKNKPFFNSLFALLMLFNKFSNIAKQCSPTAFPLPSGELTQAIFFSDTISHIYIFHSTSHSTNDFQIDSFVD